MSSKINYQYTVGQSSPVGAKKQCALKRPVLFWLYQVAGQSPAGLKNQSALDAGQILSPLITR
ncbi:hypothetical protein D3C77_718500 [compost metagenome]